MNSYSHANLKEFEEEYFCDSQPIVVPRDTVDQFQKIYALYSTYMDWFGVIFFLLVFFMSFYTLTAICFYFNLHYFAPCLVSDVTLGLLFISGVILGITRCGVTELFIPIGFCIVAKTLVAAGNEFNPNVAEAVVHSSFVFFAFQAALVISVFLITPFLIDFLQKPFEYVHDGVERFVWRMIVRLKGLGTVEVESEYRNFEPIDKYDTKYINKISASIPKLAAVFEEIAGQGRAATRAEAKRALVQYVPDNDLIKNLGLFRDAFSERKQKCERCRFYSKCPIKPGAKFENLYVKDGW